MKATIEQLIREAREVRADVMLAGYPIRQQMRAWNALRGLARDLADALEEASRLESVHPDDFRAIARERDQLWAALREADAELVVLMAVIVG